MYFEVKSNFEKDMLSKQVLNVVLSTVFIFYHCHAVFSSIVMPKRYAMVVLYFYCYSIVKKTIFQ